MGIDLTPERIHTALIYLLVVIVSISIHEFAHAITADRLGDDTPRRQGRITLLPTEHFDPLGFLMIVFLAFGGVGLGWGKPVMVNPANLKHPRRDMILIAAAGPFSNLIQATIVGLALRFMGSGPLLGFEGANLTHDILVAFLSTNLTLMFFNLIPIPPLDGSKVLSNMLPLEQAMRYDRAMSQFGFVILVGLVFLARGLLWQILNQPTVAMMQFLTGRTLF